MSNVNWELMKFKYEVLEASLEDLSAEHGISPSALQYAARDWNQVPLVERGKDFDASSGIQEDVVKQSKVFSLLKEKYLGPKYIELETTLLHKAIEVANNLPSEGPGVAKTIKDLAEIYKNLSIEKNKGSDDDLDVLPTSWEVTIIDPESREKEEKDEQDPTTTSPTKVSPIRYEEEAV